LLAKSQHCRSETLDIEGSIINRAALFDKKYWRAIADETNPLISNPRFTSVGLDHRE
jgi:deoxyribodipyrimidine photolyase-like uncharacterized protein